MNAIINATGVTWTFVLHFLVVANVLLLLLSGSPNLPIPAHIRIIKGFVETNKYLLLQPLLTKICKRYRRTRKKQNAKSSHEIRDVFAKEFYRPSVMITFIIIL